MNECVKNFLTEIIITSAALGGSFILNCVLAFKLYTKPKLKVDKPTEIELVNLNKQKTEEEPLEDYIMTIGTKNEIIKCNLPEWVVKEYNKEKNNY